MFNSVINDLVVILFRWTAVRGLSRAVFLFKPKQKLWKSFWEVQNSPRGQCTVIHINYKDMLNAWINLVSALCKGNWSFWRAHQRLWWDQSAWKKATSEVNFRISVNTNTCVAPHIPVCLKRFFFQSCRVHEGWSQVHTAEILHWGIWTRITGNCSFWIKGGTLPHLNKNGYITVVSCWQLYDKLLLLSDRILRLENMNSGISL